MLRTNISKNISQKEPLVLQTNQNFFVRTAIANIAKIILATVILVAVVVAITTISASIAASSTTVDIATATAPSFIIIIAYIIYAIYFIATISEIVTLYKKSTAIENAILSDQPAQPKQEEAPIIKTEQEPSNEEEDI